MEPLIQNNGTSGQGTRELQIRDKLKSPTSEEGTMVEEGTGINCFPSPDTVKKVWEGHPLKSEV